MANRATEVIQRTSVTVTSVTAAATEPRHHIVCNSKYWLPFSIPVSVGVTEALRTVRIIYAPAATCYTNLKFLNPMQQRPVRVSEITITTSGYVAISFPHLEE